MLPHPVRGLLNQFADVPDRRRAEPTSQNLGSAVGHFQLIHLAIQLGLELGVERGRGLSGLAGVEHLDAILLELVVQGSRLDAEQACGFQFVALGLLHGLPDPVALDLVEHLRKRASELRTVDLRQERIGNGRGLAPGNRSSSGRLRDLCQLLPAKTRASVQYLLGKVVWFV